MNDENIFGEIKNVTTKINSILKNTPEIKNSQLFFEGELISLRQYIAKNMKYTPTLIELTHKTLCNTDVENQLKLREYTFQKHEDLTKNYFQTLKDLYELKENKSKQGKDFNKFHESIFKLLSIKEIQTLNTYTQVKKDLLETLNAYLQQTQNAENKLDQTRINNAINTLDALGSEYLNNQINKTPRKLQHEAYTLTKREEKLHTTPSDDDLAKKISKLFLIRKQYKN